MTGLELGERLRAHREAAGLTQARVAELVGGGATPRDVSRWESTGGLTVRQLRALAVVLLLHTRGCQVCGAWVTTCPRHGD